MYSSILKINTMASTNILLKLSILILFCIANFFSYLEAFTFVTNTSKSNNVVTCIDREREALIKFKEGVVDPSNFLSSWNIPDCCKWRGVTCNYSTGEVLKLDLSNPNCYLESDKCLGGKLTTTTLSELQYLTYLDLSYNSFSGMIPPSLGNLSNLRVLDLYYNDLSVSDLNWLSDLSSLEFLDLSYVNLSLATTHWLQAVNMLPSLSKLYLRSTNLHNIPVSLSHLNLTSLSVLDLSYNYFSTQPPQWLFNISSLTVLNLEGCQLSGQLPNSLGHLKYLRWLTLDNSISGPLPKSIGELLKLEYLDLSYNKFSGQLPDALGNLKYLRTLRISSNSISGWLPKSIGELLKLEYLDLSNNKFSGQLPDALGNLKYLRTLSISSNSISGWLPKSIGELLKLENLDLRYNKLNGSIPKSLGKLENLQELYLQGNDWQGVLLQDHFQGLSKLKLLYISSTKPSLVLNLSSNWVPPFSLTRLYVWDIKLGPKFPLWLQTQTQIEYLSLQNVSISDKIPNCLWKMSPHILYLVLSDNQIRGTIPQRSVVFPSRGAIVDLRNNALEGPLPLWPNVWYLHLSNNSFSGPIPSDIAQIMPELVVLSLSMNSLNGSIPSSLGKMKNLYLLDMKNNHLSGNIPSSLCSSPTLMYLQLSKNMFSGELPSSLKNCKDLIMLDLGGNRISGRIPEWIGESLLLLEELSLQGNLFSGRISQKLCHLQQLRVLDLRRNNLSGPIPPCLGNLSTMKSTKEGDLYSKVDMELFLKGRESVYGRSILPLVKLIDLSNNILSGYVPEDITNLSGLISLNLSNNHLIGQIPQRIGELLNLETLDLSSNLFSGQIPQSMTSMTFLSNLNLSHNNLSGPIPSSTQFTTFQDKSIYEGNPGLCGGPLSNKCTPDVVKEDGDRQHRGQVKKEDNEEKLGLYVSITLGFFVGFWGICGSLVMKKAWRDAYYGFLYKMKDYIIMVVIVKVNKFRRMIETNN